MQTTQLYEIVNAINNQSTGKVDITVVDTQSFISLGDSVLSSNDNTEGFLNSLCQLVYKDIVEGRAYHSHMKGFIKDTMQWGAIIRKISVEMPDIVEERAIGLEDGQSIDQYEVKLPKIKQHLYVNRTPYSAFVTIQRQWLKEAFRSELDMESFIASVFLKVQNRLEMSIEGLSKAALNNYAGMLDNTQKLNLVTMYNEETGKELAAGMSALHDADFMRFAVGVIKEVMNHFTTMSTRFNKDREERHTPYDKQDLILLSKFQTQLETVALYGAFNEEYLKLAAKTVVPYWQASKDKNISPLNFNAQAKIKVDVRQPGADAIDEDVELTNVVAMLADVDAVGAYRQMEEVLTTPINARGKYYNTFWHEQQCWFNATDENFVIFTLN